MVGTPDKILGGRVTKGPEPAQQTEQVKVGAYSINRGQGVGTEGRCRSQGVCWYCFNQYPEYQEPPHRFRNQCPWFKKHLLAGTMHVNENDRLCRGLPRPSAPEFLIHPGKPEGAQVVTATAGAPEGENVERRPSTICLLNFPDNSYIRLAFIQRSVPGGCLNVIRNVSIAHAALQKCTAISCCWGD